MQSVHSALANRVGRSIPKRRPSLLLDPSKNQLAKLKSALSSWDGVSGDWYRLVYDISGFCLILAPGPLEAVVLAAMGNRAGEGNVSIRRVATD